VFIPETRGSLEKSSREIEEMNHIRVVEARPAEESVM